MSSFQEHSMISFLLFFINTISIQSAIFAHTVVWEEIEIDLKILSCLAIVILCYEL